MLCCVVKLRQIVRLCDRDFDYFSQEQIMPLPQLINSLKSSWKLEDFVGLLLINSDRRNFESQRLMTTIKWEKFNKSFEMIGRNIQEKNIYSHLKHLHIKTLRSSIANLKIFKIKCLFVVLWKNHSHFWISWQKAFAKFPIKKLKKKNFESTLNNKEF